MINKVIITKNESFLWSKGLRGLFDLSKGEVGLKSYKFLVTFRIVFSKKKNSRR